MRLFFDSLRFPLVGCPVCGSYFVHESLLCLPCEKAMLLLAKPSVESIGAWRVRSLFSWRPGESDALSALIVGLKGPHRKMAWKFWAKTFARIQGPHLPTGTLHLLSAPLRAGESQDHASAWAEGLTYELGLTHWGAPFQKMNKKQKRKLNREGRLQADPLVKITTQDLPREGPWVLADDILTTGSTARGVHRALGRPLEYEIWCLARRENERTFQSEEVLL